MPNVSNEVIPGPPRKIRVCLSVFSVFCSASSFSLMFACGLRESQNTQRKGMHACLGPRAGLGAIVQTGSEHGGACVYSSKHLSSSGSTVGQLPQWMGAFCWSRLKDGCGTDRHLAGSTVHRSEVQSALRPLRLLQGCSAELTRVPPAEPAALILCPLWP
jgi:hypothetical protein